MSYRRRVVLCACHGPFGGLPIRLADEVPALSDSGVDTVELLCHDQQRWRAAAAQPKLVGMHAFEHLTNVVPRTHAAPCEAP